MLLLWPMSCPKQMPTILCKWQRDEFGMLDVSVKYQGEVSQQEESGDEQEQDDLVIRTVTARRIR